MNLFLTVLLIISIVSTLKASSISSNRYVEADVATNKKDDRLKALEEEILALISKHKSYKSLFHRRPCFLSKKSCYFYG